MTTGRSIIFSYVKRKNPHMILYKSLSFQFLQRFFYVRITHYRRVINNLFRLMQRVYRILIGLLLTLLIPARTRRIGKERVRELELVGLAVDAPENLVAVIEPEEKVRHLLRRVIGAEARVVVVLRRVVGVLAELGCGRRGCK